MESAERTGCNVLPESAEANQCDAHSLPCELRAMTCSTVLGTCNICESNGHFVSNMLRTTIDDLPDEMIIKILSYFSFNELVDVIQNVCVRWRKLAHDPELWRDKVYIIRQRAQNGRSCCGVLSTECIHCRCEKTEKEVLRTLHMIPQLRTLIMMRATKRSVLRTLSRKCRNITTLQIHGCQKMSHSLLQEIFDNWSKIHTLIMANGLLADRQYVEIVSNLKHLRSLELFECRSSSAPIQLRLLADICPQLQKIDLSWAYYPLEDLEYFLNVKKFSLTSVTLRWTMEAKRCVVPLLAECLHTIIQLELHIYDVVPQEEADVFTALGQLHSLREFTARQLSPRQPTMVPLAFKHGCLPQLQRLHLQYSSCLGDDTIIALSQGCPALRELRLHHSEHITDKAFTKVQCLQHLEILEVSGCNGLGGTAVARIAQLPALHTLVLQEMNDLKKLEPGLQQILDMKKLRCLDLLNSGNIKIVPFDKFPGRLESLRELHANCNEVPSFLDNLCRQMPHVRIYKTFQWTEDDWLTDYETDEDNGDEDLNINLF